MRKTDEMNIPGSCLNKAKDEELLFVLRGHDTCAPIAIRTWIEARVLTGKNTLGDPQIQEAMKTAGLMEIEHHNGKY